MARKLNYERANAARRMHTHGYEQAWLPPAKRGRKPRRRMPKNKVQGKGKGGRPIEIHRPRKKKAKDRWAHASSMPSQTKHPASGSPATASALHSNLAKKRQKPLQKAMSPDEMAQLCFEREARCKARRKARGASGTTFEVYVRRKGRLCPISPPTEKRGPVSEADTTLVTARPDVEMS